MIKLRYQINGLFLIDKYRKATHLPTRKFSDSAEKLYVQGQSPVQKDREYFYYIDHEGMLFLDDAKLKNFTSCFKDKKFLTFFFKRVRFNDTNRYVKEFPYVSLCGRERNFIRCDDLPIVFTSVTPASEDCQADQLFFAHSTNLRERFEPEKIYMSPDTGRVYHPAKEQYGSVGLIRSKLAIEFSKHFEFDESGRNPTHFTWNNQRYQLENEWLKNIRLGNRSEL